MHWLFRLGSALVVLVLLAFGVLALIPSEQVARLATDRFAEVTGRQLTIEGSVKPSLWPVLGVETGRVTLSNADWSDEGPMLVAEGMSIKLDLQALMGGEVRITGFELLRPEILLERSEEGVPNWVFGGANGGTASAGMAGADKPFTLDLAVIHDGALGYLDHATGQAVQLSGLEATLSLPEYDGPLSVALSAETSGQALSVEGRLGDFRTLYEGGVAPVVLDARLGAASLSFDGRGGGQPFAAEGAVEADLGDLAAVATVLALEPPALPEGFGARKVAVAGKVTLSAERDWYLRGGRITLDDTVLTGDLDVTTGGERLRVAGNLATGALALGSEGAGGGSGGGTGAGGWSGAPLSAEGLRAVDADLGLAVDDLRLGALRLGAVRSHVTVDAGRAVADLGRVSAYGGTLAGQVVVNARKGLSVGGRLDLAGVALQPLLTDAMGYDRLIGTGDLTLDFVGAGGSVAEIMRRLDGQGSVTLGPGEVRGIDIPAMLATLNASQMGPQEKTVFDSLSASFQIEKGDLFNEDLKLSSPYVRATGAGRVGLGARDFDYRLKAMALQGEDGADRITVPIWITGPWAAPKVALDVEALAQEKLQEQAKAAEDELRRRAAEELGQQEGETLEDAAKRKLQEQVDEQAGKLLEQLLGGGN
ncbi:AsmA family protein [Paragemmobacter straminiformis]|uniref:AsmA family protein n=1 Tax=Paragemmobacter straminiformis TaxID=2045119 RepID=A0A842IDP1_9RHOB|nr:AsmA family protein [Gemmobacter straminiformis]MBC2837164.1 AsmA family protein [Gemmobacter straminiformis]